MPCRDQEQQKIYNTLLGCLKNNQSGVICICLVIPVLLPFSLFVYFAFRYQRHARYR